MVDTKQTVLGPGLLREAKRAGGGHGPMCSSRTITPTTPAETRPSAVRGPRCRRTPGAASGCRSRLRCIRLGLDQKIDALKKSTVEGAKEAAADAEAFKAGLAKVKPEAFVPQPTLEGGKPLDLAGHKIEVHHVGPGHTDNDVFFFFPKENVLVAGDLIFNGLHAYYDSTGGANSTGWIKSLGRIVTLCNEKTVVVSGHGPVGDVESLAKKQIKYFGDMQAAVAKAIKDGKDAGRCAEDDAAAVFGVWAQAGNTVGHGWGV